MKQSATILAVAALLFAGCAKNETVVKSGSDAISFSGYTGRAMTKAASDMDEYKVDSGYRVCAFLGNSVYFLDDFRNDTPASIGTPSKTYYWPTSISGTNKMVFYAAAPIMNVKPEGLKNKKVVDFAANPGTTDLVVAKSDEYSTKSESVSLTFKHALSKISKFTLQSKTATSPDTPDGSATADYKYNVESLEISGNMKGTCNFSSGSPVWESTSEPGTHTYAKKSDAKSFAGDKTLVIDTPVKAVIPQDITISVKYSITYGEATVFGPVTKTGTLNVGAGNAYSITITLTNDNSPIIFNATKTDWNSQTPAVEVHDAFEEIRTALASASAGGKVTLTKDYSGQCTKPIVIPDGRTLDLGGYTLDATGSLFCDSFIQVGDGSDATKQPRLFLNGKVTFKGWDGSCVIDLHTAKARIDNFNNYIEIDKQGNVWDDTQTSHWIDTKPFHLSSGSATRVVLKRSVSDETEKYYAFICSTNGNTTNKPECLIGSISGFKKEQIYLNAYTGDGLMWTTLTDATSFSTNNSEKVHLFSENVTKYNVTFTPSMYWIESSGGPT